MYDVTAALAEMPDVFSAQRAMAAGISSHVLRRLVRHKSVIRVQPGVYRQPVRGEPDEERWSQIHREHLLRARSAASAHPDHALSHRSAAVAFGWPVLLHPDEPVHLTALHVEPRSRRSRDRVLHHSDSIINDAVMVDGVRLMAPDRTVADCLRTMMPPSAVAVADGALRGGATDLQDVQRSLDSMRRWRGRPKASAALRLIDPRRETWLESFSFVTLHELGIELPTPQVEIFDQWGRLVGRVDAMWIADGVVGEADGLGKYLMGVGDRGGDRGVGDRGVGDDAGASGRAAALRVVKEKIREDDMRGLGLEFVRWDPTEIRHEPLKVAQRVELARSRGDLARFQGRLRVNGQWINPSEHR